MGGAPTLPADQLPNTAGVGATVTVNIDLKSLIDGIKAGTLSTGCRISAAEVRRMACEQGLLPMVFNGETLPLDCGRTKRLFTRAQRLAMERRDHGCTFPGNGGPPAELRIAAGETDHHPGASDTTPADAGPRAAPPT